MATFLRNSPLSRRTFLRGTGACVALPLLDAMVPVRAAPGPIASRKRLCLVFLPNGAHMPEWTPEGEGAQWKARTILEPLEPLRSELLVLSGFGLSGAAAHGDGPGDHARAAAAFLTTAHPRKTAGSDLRAGVSVDQVAANTLGQGMDFPSLVLGCEPGRRAGSCDSGYSCAYSHHISWSSPSEPCAKETNPRRVFARLYGDPDDARSRHELMEHADRQRSVLDFVLEDSRRLERRIGAADRDRVERYQESIREVERRLQRFTQRALEAPPIDPPAARPSSYPEHLDLMYQLTALAFAADRTRVVSLMVANAGSNRSYRWLDVPEGHHALSHHEKKPDKQEKIRRIDRFHVERFAEFLRQLAALDETGASVLDQSLVLFGSGIGDGNRHNHDDLPIVLAGRGGGDGPRGEHLRVRRGTPLANVYLSMLHRLDVPISRFGDSDGEVAAV